MKRWLALFLSCLMTLSAARAETVLNIRIHHREFVNEAFAAAHPDVTLIDNGYLSPEELQRALVTRSFAEDAFTVNSDNVDLANLIDKGYCLDLSGNDAIREAVSRMYPAMRAQVMRGDAIYALPLNVHAGNNPYLCNEELWVELGYTKADVPKTFPALLDFLEGWMDRVEAESLPYCVNDGWDDERYNVHTYAGWLVGLLMDSYIAQEEYAGKPLRFNNQELIDLLKRAKRVGEDIYRRCEPSKSSSGRNGAPLFSHANLYLGGWDKLEDWMPDMRIRADQPSLMDSSMRLGIVYAGTGEPEMAMEVLSSELLLIEKGLPIGDTTTAFLYADAEPIPNYRQASSLRHYRNMIAIAEHRLVGDATPITEYLELEDSDYVSEKSYEDASAIADFTHFYNELAGMLDSEIEDTIKELQANLAYVEEDAWYFSPEELTAYRAYAQHFTFAMPGPFRRDTDERTNYESLLSQYVNDLMTAEQLAFQLEHIARMQEMESR